jgi:antitoxin (DNA-binding transcriptional repressor) of toxin-antitoxin stability system
MKTMSIEHPKDELKELLAAAHEDRVLVKRGGKPVALVIDVREKDEEQIRLENDPEFWRMIQKSRREPTTPWEQVKSELGLGGMPGRRSIKVRRKSKKK